MSWHWGKEGWKGLPSAWLSSEKRYGICSPLQPSQWSDMDFLGGGGSWANGAAAFFLISKHWGGEFVCYRAHKQLRGCGGSSGWGCVSWWAPGYNEVGGLFAHALQGHFKILLFLSVVGIQTKSRSFHEHHEKAAVFLPSRHGIASEDGSCAVSSVSEATGGDFWLSPGILACDWWLCALALHSGGFTGPAMGHLWYEVLTAGFTSIFCVI